MRVASLRSARLAQPFRRDHKPAPWPFLPVLDVLRCFKALLQLSNRQCGRIACFFHTHGLYALAQSLHLVIHVYVAPDLSLPRLGTIVSPFSSAYGGSRS